MSFLSRVARRAPTAVSLENLFRFGREAGRDPSQRLRNAQFLHAELQIRIAQRVVELEALPLGLPQTGPIKSVIGWYSDYFERVAESPFPHGPEDEQGFTDLLNFILQDNSEVIHTTSRGVLEIRKRRGGFSWDEQRQIDSVLNRFFLARIGLRFLIEHHLTSLTPRVGYAGLIEAACSPLDAAKRAADDAAALCEYHLGTSPEVEFEVVARNERSPGARPVSFTYVPTHLHYILSEVFKNSFKATAERWADAPSAPPVRVTIVEGVSDVSMRISDRGGGIEGSKMPLIWSYLHSTAQDPTVQASLVEDGTAGSVLAGFGVGLPLSRLYARYFGGDLDLKSLHGHGSDTFLRLPRLGANCENLPAGVITSPGERDSSLPRGESQVFFFADRRSYETAVRLGQAPSFVPAPGAAGRREPPDGASRSG